jgi:hypothetical protein
LIRLTEPYVIANLMIRDEMHGYRLSECWAEVLYLEASRFLARSISSGGLTLRNMAYRVKS